jgi:type I restriction enzyme S subunit
MRKDFFSIKLSEIADVIAGQSPESIYYSNIKGIPFLQGNRTFGNLYPSIDTFTSKVTKIAKKGDVLMSVRAPVGDLNYAPCDLCIGRGLASIKAKNGNNNFIYYALKYNINTLLKQGNGTTFDSVNKDVINDFELIIPESILDRVRVTEVLHNLDSKIELNNRINAELEAMAKTIYDYWFVQFDFPDKNGKPYKSSGGKMVWNNELKRDIPEGWDVKFLSDWIEKDKSGDWGKESEEGNYSERVHCIRGADINGLNGKGEIKSPVRYILPKNSHKILEPFDLIIEISGGSPTQSTGRLAFLMDETLSRFDAPVICSNFCKAVTLKEQKSTFNFVFEWNNAYNNGILFGFEGKTSGIKNLLFESFVSSYKTPVPPIKLMTHFFNTVISFEIKKQKGLKENNELEALRDWLLPMLMNGQVKVN